MKYLRFSDLQERNIVTNRVTLGRWQKQLGFPLGFLIGPNTRAWPEDEIQAWRCVPVHRQGRVTRHAQKAKAACQGDQCGYCES